MKHQQTAYLFKTTVPHNFPFIFNKPVPGCLMVLFGDNKPLSKSKMEAKLKDFCQEWNYKSYIFR